MFARSRVQHLRSDLPTILPSMLLCDFGNLQREVGRLEAAGLRGFHLDVMDGHFVPNFTYGLSVVAAFRQLTDLPLDVHLMIERPQRYLQQFADAGADIITVHAEAVDELGTTLREIRDLGRAAGVAINPSTPLETILPDLEECDLVLAMSVDPGFGGQAMNTVALEKIGRLKELVGSDVLLEIDGGVNAETIGACAAVGADLLVVGSAIFGEQDYAAAVRQLSDLV